MPASVSAWQLRLSSCNLVSAACLTLAKHTACVHNKYHIWNSCSLRVCLCVSVRAGFCLTSNTTSRVCLCGHQIVMPVPEAHGERPAAKKNDTIESTLHFRATGSPVAWQRCINLGPTSLCTRPPNRWHRYQCFCPRLPPAIGYICSHLSHRLQAPSTVRLGKQHYMWLHGLLHVEQRHPRV